MENMSKYLVRGKMIIGANDKLFCVYYLDYPDWELGGVGSLCITILSHSAKFNLSDWWRLQKQVIAKRLLESAK